MIEVAWRWPINKGVRPDWMEPSARTIDATRKYVVSGTLQPVCWSAKLVPADLRTAVDALKYESGAVMLVHGVTPPLALAELGLIDEYEFVVRPRVAGRSPTMLAGLSIPLGLTLLDRVEVPSGAVAMRFVPRL